jgi:hypothetical protein
VAFDDQFGADVDPQSVVNDLITQRMPDVAQNGAVDPQMVLNRLIRSHQHPRPVKAPGTETPDYSQFGTPAGDKTESDIDYSEFGQPAGPEEAEPKAEEKPAGVAKALGQGAIGGLVSAGGAALKGVAAQTKIPRTLGEMGTQAASVAFDPGALGRIAVGVGKNIAGSPEEKPIDESPIYKAGEATEKFAKDKLGPSEATQAAHPWATAIGSGGATAAALLGLGRVAGPGAAIAGGAAMFGLSGAGETYSHAIKSGASEETAHEAAVLSGAANAALGSIPIAKVLSPFKAIMPQATGLAMRVLAKAAEDGIVFGTVGEAQAFIGAQISRLYDKQNGILAGYKLPFTEREATDRLIANLATGAIVGGTVGAFGKGPPDNRREWSFPGGELYERRQTPGETPPPPGDEPKPDEKTKPKRETPPPPPPPGDEFDVDNDREETPPPPPPPPPPRREEEPPPRPETGAGRRDDTRSPGKFTPREIFENEAARAGEFSPEEIKAWSDEKLRAYNQQKREEGVEKRAQNKPRGRRNLEERAAYYDEFSPEDIASWTDDKLRKYVDAKLGRGSTQASDEDILKNHGYTDDEIKGTEDKAAAAQEAMREGAHAQQPEPEPGAREAPIDLKTTADVARASGFANPDHTHPQGEANNIQRGHATWNGLDITFEAAAGGTRRGLAPDGTPFETKHPHAYGYFTGLPEGADGQHPDVTVGDHPNAPRVYVIDEIDPKTGEFRQPKVFGGFKNARDAYKSYTQINLIPRSRARPPKWSRGCGPSAGTSSPNWPATACSPSRCRLRIIMYRAKPGRKVPQTKGLSRKPHPKPNPRRQNSPRAKANLSPLVKNQSPRRRSI